MTIFEQTVYGLIRADMSGVERIRAEQTYVRGMIRLDQSGSEGSEGKWRKTWQIGAEK